MEINDKVARCRLLATMIVADDNVDEVELEFLERAMEKLDLSDEEKTKVMVLLDYDEAIEAIDSLDSQERLEFLDELAELAWLDKDLDDYELDLLRNIANVMGLDETHVQSALKAAESD